MSTFGGLIQTNKGRNLQAKVQTGIELHFTRIAIGDGTLGGTSILDLNELRNEVMTLPIKKLRTLAGGRAIVGTTFDNQQITTGFYYREIGLFAQDPDQGEILYCYGNAGANAQYIPSGGGADVLEKSIDIETIIGTASNVTAIIDNSLIYVTVQDYESGLATKVDKVTGKGLSTEDFTTSEKEKLADIEPGATHYVHPDTHPASMITEDSSHRFTSDTEKAKWNSMVPKSLFTSASQFLVSSAAGQVVAKTISEIKSLLGLKSAAYKDTGSGNGLDADSVDGWHRDSIRDWGNLLNKPSTFTPSSHTHTKSQITDFPSSLPANGGNADTVDSCHADTDYNGTAYQLARYNSAGKVYNSDRVDGYHFRVSGGILQYSADGSTWINAGEGVSMIKSIQRGVITIRASTSASATISAVNPSKAIVIYGGSSTSYYITDEESARYTDAKLVLTNSTTITASTEKAKSADVFVAWQVIEFV